MYLDYLNIAIIDFDLGYLNFTLIPIVVFYIASLVFWINSKKEGKKLNNALINKLGILFVAILLITLIIIYVTEGRLDASVFSLIIILALCIPVAIIDLIVGSIKRKK